MSIIEWRDRQGNVLTDVLEWAHLYEDTAYRNVAIDMDGDWMVSTVWEGFEAVVLFPHEPAVYETAIIHQGKFLHKFRWVNEESALAGHAEMCREYLKRDPRPEDDLLQRVLDEEAKQRGRTR